MRVALGVPLSWAIARGGGEDLPWERVLPFPHPHHPACLSIMNGPGFPSAGEELPCSHREG